MNIRELVEHPTVFGVGAGVGNGVLAAVRDKPISPTAAVITSVVVALGEVALVYSIPEDEREPLLDLGLKTVAGTLIGMAPFISWQEGDPSAVQKVGEYLGDALSDTQQLLAEKRKALR